MGLWTGENASIYHFYQPIPELCGWSSGFLGRYPMSIGWGGGGSLYHTQLFQTLKSDFSALLDDPGGPLVRSSTCCNVLMHGAGAHHTLWQLCPHPQLPQRPKDTITGKFDLGIRNEAGQIIEFCQENALEKERDLITVVLKDLQHTKKCLFLKLKKMQENYI